MANQERLLATIKGTSRGPNPDSPLPEANYSGAIITDSQRGPSARKLFDFKCGDNRFQDGMCVFPGTAPARCTIVDLLNLPPFQRKEEENPVLSYQTRAGRVITDRDNQGLVWIDDKDPLKVSKTHYSFLVSLMKRGGGMATREDLLREANTKGTFTYLPPSDDITVNVHLGKLRQELGQVGPNGFIETVPGGYRLDIPVRPKVDTKITDTELQPNQRIRMQSKDGTIELDRVSGKFYSSFRPEGEEEGRLSRTQRLLFLKLFDQKGKIVRFLELQRVYKKDANNTHLAKRSIIETMKTIRMKLGLEAGQFIEAVPGEGFSLVIPDDPIDNPPANKN